jgi:hypothetical protein
MAGLGALLIATRRISMIAFLRSQRFQNANASNITLVPSEGLGRFSSVV